VGRREVKSRCHVGRNKKEGNNIRGGAVMGEIVPSAVVVGWEKG